jgi:3-phosphoshikimate 1-carboxyvinyltransferase
VAAIASLHVHGEVRVPGDKSVSHRALIFAALADGQSVLRSVLDSADVQSTASVLRALGAVVPPIPGRTPGHPSAAADAMRVTGVGLRGLRAPVGALQCGNSGTTTRLLAGVCAAYPFASRFIGDASLSRRPMRRVARPLEAMGARVTFDDGDGLPMTVTGGPLRTMCWEDQTGSAQVKSAVLLAGLVSGVPVSVHALRPSRDHTERFLMALGADVRVAPGSVSLTPPERLRPFELAVPGDPSSAAFFAALAAMAANGAVRLPDVLASPTRDAFMRTLAAMGANVASVPGALTDIGEPTATYTVAPGELRGVTIGGDDVPAMIDELPLVACVAARAEGETRITGAAELRVKESDRITLTVSNLRAVGVLADELPDGMCITGGRGRCRGRVVTRGDHRIAMAFGVLGAATGGEIIIDDSACAAVSYPDFWADLARVTSV